MERFRRVFLFIAVFIFVVGCSREIRKVPTSSSGEWFLLKRADLRYGTHHTRHAKVFGKYVDGYNYFVLKGIDVVQSHFPDGGGYFIGKDSIPPESPIGYELKLFGRSLLKPPRTTSYCSGASYTAFIEALNFILAGQANRLDFEHYEAMRMQELDGGRREDLVKFWGYWNADGFGSHYALVQYSGMGVEVEPREAMPGDFMNISWKSGLGHSVVFLGWYVGEDSSKYVVYWSSQRATNGLGDQVVPLEKIKCVKIVRLTKPENLFQFDINNEVKLDIEGDEIKL